MANPFANIKSGIEAHPVMASVVVGGVGLIVTIYFIKKNQSSSTGATQPNLCTDSNGDVIDCTTGQPVGTSGGGFSLQPTNNNSDVLTAIGNLSQSIQNLVQNLSGGTNNGTNPPPTNPPPVNNPPPVVPPRPVLPPAPQVPPRPILPPGPSGGVNPPAKRTVTVAQWSATNTPWNSTLWGIAHHFGESVGTVERLNPRIKNPNLIYAGQRVNY